VNEPMTFLDFFSGVGGFRKGFELCGMICKGHCEIDKFADRSYRAIHDVKEDEWYGEDITKTEPADLPRVNLWAGGFPCQDISVSGRQRGLAGKRSSLFFEIVRLLKGTPAEDRPEWLALENVKNLLSVNRGWDFATVLHSLAEIGYHIEYGLLNSRFHGVPQNRERIYLVAYRHFRAEGGRKVFPVTASDGKALIQLIGGTQGKRVYDPAGISCTLMSEGGGFAGRTGMYFIDLCKGNPKLTENARCIKARYDGGITNRSGDNSGVLCMGADCHDRTEETAQIQLKRGENTGTGLHQMSDRRLQQNRGKQPGRKLRYFLWLPCRPHSRPRKQAAERTALQGVRRTRLLSEHAGQARRLSLRLRFLRIRFARQASKGGRSEQT